MTITNRYIYIYIYYYTIYWYTVSGITIQLTTSGLVRINLLGFIFIFFRWRVLKSITGQSAYRTVQFRKLTASYYRNHVYMCVCCVFQPSREGVCMHVCQNSHSIIDQSSAYLSWLPRSRSTSWNRKFYSIMLLSYNLVVDCFSLLSAFPSLSFLIFLWNQKKKKTSRWYILCILTIFGIIVGPESQCKRHCCTTEYVGSVLDFAELRPLDVLGNFPLLEGRRAVHLNVRWGHPTVGKTK